ncbi:hypothetical protein BDF19DRAFT_424988 [Syncephalis fuscata]|nr:hypothetical protein BDF19DRAFT_424988 [Syncephalis fuscata]
MAEEEGSIYGKLTSVDYLAANNGTITDIRARFHGVRTQIVLVMIMFVIFASNTIKSFSLVAKRPNQVAPWCCFIAALMGVIYLAGFTIPSNLPGGPSCKTVIDAASVCLTIAIMATNTLLLERAYLAHRCNRWMLFIGAGLILTSPAFIIVSITKLEPRYSPASGCYGHYPDYYPYVRLAVDVPANIVFSISFTIVIYQQYQRFGDQCWKQLAKEGITTMMLVILSNFLCTIGNVIQVFHEASDALFILDCQKAQQARRHGSPWDSPQRRVSALALCTSTTVSAKGLNFTTSHASLHVFHR